MIRIVRDLGADRSERADRVVLPLVVGEQFRDAGQNFGVLRGKALGPGEQQSCQQFVEYLADDLAGGWIKPGSRRSRCSSSAAIRSA